MAAHEINSAETALERVFSEDASRILSIFIGACGGDFTLAEDAMQEAFESALQSWPSQGIPCDPVAWLITAGKRKAIDQLRRDRLLG